MRQGPTRGGIRGNGRTWRRSTPSLRQSATEPPSRRADNPRRRSMTLTSSTTTAAANHAQPSTSTASYRGPGNFPSPSPKSQNTSPPSEINDLSPSPASPTCDTAEVMKLVALLPPSVRHRLETDPNLPRLIEVVMDLGRPPLARFPAGDVCLSDQPVTGEDLGYAVAACGEFGGDNRAGIDGTLHRISAIRNRAGRVVGLTCRVGRAIKGSACMVADLVTQGKSILLLGRPGVGKTTAIREISRMLADDSARRVVIVDTSNEIGGDGDIPHPGIGASRRMQVPLPEQQHRVMIEAVENHMPEVVMIDEIGTEAEALAARTIAQRGVQLIATAHGNELENVMKNPSLNDLVGGIASVTLGDEEAKRRGVQKSVLERESPPTFDVAVEMQSRQQWRVHLDVAAAVDAVLLGRDAGAEVRESDADGRVWAWPEDESTDTEDDESLASASASSIGGGNGAGVSRGRRQTQADRDSGYKVLTQGFPPEALAAARGEVWSPSGAEERATASQAAAAVARLKEGKKKGRTATATTPGTALKVFLYGIDPESVRSVAEALSMPQGIAIAERVQDADAVLATRARLKSSGWIRGAAQAAGIPMFSLRSASVEHVVRGVRTLLGIDPSPGGLFAPTGTNDGLAGADPRVASTKVLRAETSVALVQKASDKAAGSGRAAAVHAEKEAMAEARGAIELIVLKQGQPVELQPREAAVVERQVALAREFGLRCEVAGASAAVRRVRILPAGWAAEEVAPVQVENKEYW